MELAHCLFGDSPPRRGGACVVALVGAGGKTSALFALAEELAAPAAGPRTRILVTTTTNIVDPRVETGRRFGHFRLEPRLAAGSWQEGGGFLPPGFAPFEPGITVLASDTMTGCAKLRGIDPRSIPCLAPLADYIIVEADGSRGLSVKAPADHEPVMPEGADMVIGIVGLDCLGAAMGPGTVHRSELFGPLAGIKPGEPIAAGHLAALAASKDGLFKSAPEGARRVLLLNKAELLGAAGLDALAVALDRGPRPLADLVIACSLAAPSNRVLARLGAAGPARARGPARAGEER
jgi:probable selenium-dependent hydroxylase accessory protein YqeC